MHPAEELKNRSKQFAIRVVKLFRSLPRTEDARIMGRQVLRAGTSVAANYRAVCRARSKAEFIAKIGVVVEEADETIFWLELLVDTGVVRESRMRSLMSGLTNYWQSSLPHNIPRENGAFIESMGQ